MTLTRKQKRKRKRLMRLCVNLSMLGVVGVLVFFVGASVGAKNKEESVAVATKEQYVKPEVILQEESLERPKEPEVVTEETEDVSGIILVNRENPLPEDYEVELITLPDGYSKAAEEAYEPLCAMLKAGQEEGMNFRVCSSYRSVERQEELFEEDLEELIREGYSYLEAYDEVARETMPPGYSEHATGLAFDIVAADYQMLDKGQARTEENEWLQKNCAEYGFILRYPKGKEDITGISYESWHFRYVGKETAQYIMEEGITLEEYFQEQNVGIK